MYKIKNEKVVYCYIYKKILYIVKNVYNYLENIIWKI